jgi:hypothetical protein
MIFQSLHNKTREARQAKCLAVQFTASTARDLRVTPTQRHPNVEQIQRQRHQQKTQGWVRRSRPTPYLIGTAVTGFDGLITNDKFCFVRTAQLQLNWWRRPLRLRQAQSTVDATFWEKGNLPGGTDETGVADSATDGRASGWTTALGSGISVPAAMGPNHITGGAECE